MHYWRLHSFLGIVRDGIYCPILKKYTPFIKKMFPPPASFLPYLMLVLINPVYLLLTEKTNWPGILTMIYIYIYICIKFLSKPHNTQVGIYFTFAMESKIGIDPFYQSCYLTYSVTATIYIYAVIHPSLICIKLWD